LAREDDAAATIQRLSYCVESDSELAKKARSYAAELRQLIARLRAALPPDDGIADADSELCGVSEGVIQSLRPEQAATVLIRFLLQHAETTSEILQSAGGKLNSKAVEMLWRQAERERRKIANWAHQLESACGQAPVTVTPAKTPPAPPPAFVPPQPRTQLVKWM
jgi:hypothetical protein